MGVLHAIKDNDEPRGVDDGIQPCVWMDCAKANDALVGNPLARAVEQFAALEAHRH